MRNGVLIGVVAAVFSAGTVCAAGAGPHWRLAQRYRHDLRQEKQHQFLERLSAAWEHGAGPGRVFRFEPYLEGRANVARNTWERTEAGVEAGCQVFPWLYAGQVLLRGWAREEYRDYGMYEKRDYTETRTRLVFSRGIGAMAGGQARVFFLEEFNYELDRGVPSRNEIGAGVVMPVAKAWEAELGWRHIDRVHYFDSDTLEAAFTFKF